MDLAFKRCLPHTERAQRAALSGIEIYTVINRRSDRRRLDVSRSETHQVENYRSRNGWGCLLEAISTILWPCSTYDTLILANAESSTLSYILHNHIISITKTHLTFTAHTNFPKSKPLSWKRFKFRLCLSQSQLIAFNKSPSTWKDQYLLSFRIILIQRGTFMRVEQVPILIL